MNEPQHERNAGGKDQILINQVSHLIHGTVWESDKNTRKHHIQESQEVSSLTAGDHNDASNRQDSMTDNT